MLQLIGIHLTNKLDAETAYSKLKYLIDNNGYEVSDVAKLDTYIEEIMQLTFVNVEKVRVFDFSTLEIYDIGVVDFLNSENNFCSFDIRECGSGYIINLAGSGYRVNIILPVYFNDELLLDLTEYGGSNTIKLSDLTLIGGIEIYIDAKTNDISLYYNRETLLGSDEIKNSYNESKLVRAHYIDFTPESTPDEIFTCVCEKFSDSILIFFEKIAFLCLSNIVDDVVIVPNGVERLVVDGRLKVKTNIMLPPSLKIVRGEDSKADETLVSFGVSKNAGLEVIKGLTGCGFSNLCWCMCMNETDTVKILEIIAEYTIVKVHLY